MAHFPIGQIGESLAYKSCCGVALVSECSVQSGKQAVPVAGDCDALRTTEHRRLRVAMRFAEVESQLSIDRVRAATGLSLRLPGLEPLFTQIWAQEPCLKPAGTGWGSPACDAGHALFAANC